MSDENQSQKIQKHHHNFQFSVGIFLIIIIAVYILFHLFSSITKKNVTTYEVNLGSIVERNFYQAMAIRQEAVYNADKNGMVYYYGGNKSRVGVKSLIYAVDTSGDMITRLTDRTGDFRTITGEELLDLNPRIDNYLGSFQETGFNSTYSFKTDVEDYLTDILVRDLSGTFSAEIDAAKARGTYFDYRAPRPGFLVYTLDGYEGKDISNFSGTDFNALGLNSQNLRTREKIASGDPAYKLILSDDWQLIIPVDKRRYEEFMDQNTLQIRFNQDDSKTWTNVSVMEREGAYYLVLSLDDSMERYANQRFVNIELLIDEKEGLKIPNSALVEKEFYVIPKKYFYAGGNSTEPGIMVRNDRGDNFIIPNIYNENEDSYYISTEDLTAGDKIIRENSNDAFTVGETAVLKGVYNINKGYTVFRAVEVLYTNEDYTIVRNRKSYSIALYDHIVLNADLVKENEII